MRSFDVSFGLNICLKRCRKKGAAEFVARSDMINVAYVRQKKALGLGTAVLRAQELVGEERLV